MFFIMGSNAKIVQLGPVGAVCPGCGRALTFNLCKSFSYLHLFFIPVFRWHVRYVATCPGCAAVYEVAPEAGKAAEKGKLATLPSSSLTPLRNGGRAAGICPHCGGGNPPGSAFCNRCGGRL